MKPRAKVATATIAGVLAVAVVTVGLLPGNSDPCLANGTIFGTSPVDDAPTAEVQFNLPEDALEAPDGTLYVSETQSDVIRRIKHGVVSVFAGTFETGYNGDGPRLKTRLNRPTSLQFTADRKAIIFADSGNYLIRRIDLRTGRITTLAGKPGDNSLPADGAIARLSPIGYVATTRLDANGNLWFPSSDFDGRYSISGEIFYLDPEGVLHHHALPSAAGDLTRVRDLNLGPGYVEFTRESSLVRVHDDGTIQQVDLGSDKGKGIARLSDSTTLVGVYIWLLSLDENLNVSVAETGFANVANIRKSGRGILITDSDRGVIVRYVNGEKTNLNGSARGGFGALVSLARFSDSSVLVLDNQRPRIFLLEVATGRSTTWAGTGAQGWATIGAHKLSTSFRYPNAVAVDSANNVYVVEQSRILKISRLHEKVHLLAGATEAGDEDGTGAEARFRSPAGISVDAAGNVIVADTYNNKIRKVSRAGVVTTIAGTGSVDMPTFGVSATESALNRPHGVLALPDGRLLVADSWNNAVYAIDADGVLRPFAGKPNRAGYQGAGTFSGDAGRAIDAGMNTPVGLAMDSEGTVYIGDRFNHRIRAVSTSGPIRTLAGGGGPGFARQGKKLNSPAGLEVLGDQLLVADTGNKIVVRYCLN